MTSAAQRSAAPKLASVVPFPQGRGRATRGASAEAAGISKTALLHAVVCGDPSAPGLVWDMFHVSVRAVLRRSLGPGADVEDALQEVFIQFFRSASAVREPEALGGFMTGIAVRVARGELRKRRVRRWFSLTRDGELPEPDPEHDPSREAARRAVKRLYAILDELDDESRLLFVLRHVERLELVDVAAALDVSLSTVKRKLARVTPVVIARCKRDQELCGYVRGDTDGDATLLSGEVEL